MERIEISIIGAGPAGLTAGLYAIRSGRSVVVCEALSPGGQAATSWCVDNYPGLPHVNGGELMLKMETQVKELGLRIVSAEVVKLLPGKPHRLITTGPEIAAQTVILATGAKPRLLGIPGENLFRGRGVSYCGTCDGAFFRDLPVAVIGGGNTALEEAEFLTRFASQVYLIHRREQFRADHILQQTVYKNPKIQLLTPFTAKEIIGDEQGVKELLLESCSSQATQKLPVKGVFIFVGIDPQTSLLKDLLPLDGNGFIPTAPDLSTSIPGIFAAGDCRANRIKQIVVAAGEGATAAMMANQYLQSLA